MPATTSQAPKAQPWKANWPPAKQTSQAAANKYLVDDAGALLIDGSHECASADLFAKLTCSRKETEAPKVQPWKANWPPAKHTSNAAGNKYLVDDAGALLIDGAHNCVSADLFAELVSSRKEAVKE